jgi:hypothetical protein
MTDQWANGVRQSFSRVFVAVGRPSFPARLALVAAIAVGFALGLVLVIAAALLALPVLVVGGLYLAARRAVARLKAPGGRLDGRRNVRVIVRDSQS